MKTLFAFCALLLAAAAPSRAEVELRVSIKVLLGAGDAWPNNPNTIPPTGLNLNSETVLRDNIKFTNEILSRHGTCYRLVLRNNTIYTLSGFPAMWYAGDPRAAGDPDATPPILSFSQALESQATMNATAKATWQWHDDAINIYLNSGRSGQCAFPGQSNAITIGAGGYDTLILHEIGHFFGLRHTHTTEDANEDTDTDPTNDNSVDDWGNGDSSDETLDDDSDASPAQILTRYNNVFPQSAIDDLIFNIMSYHSPQDRFVWAQREVLITNFNTTRANVALGRTRFVLPVGNDSSGGLSVTTSLRTIGRGVNMSGSTNDVVLILGGTYLANHENLPQTINTPVTLGAWRGPVTITR
jgi:hypothetical protein